MYGQESHESTDESISFSDYQIGDFGNRIVHKQEIGSNLAEVDHQRR